jgi:hypothetical protein
VRTGAGWKITTIAFSSNLTKEDEKAKEKEKEKEKH